MAVQFSGETRIVNLKSVAESMIQSIPEDERKRMMVGDVLVSVERVKVFHPHRRDRSCLIYGEISFSNYPSGPFFTLFNRSRDDPDSINLSDPEFQFLTLSDNQLYHHPLVGGDPICIKIKLFERKQFESDSDSDHDDEDGEDEKPKEVSILNPNSDSDHDDEDGEDEKPKEVSILNPKPEEEEEEEEEEEDTLIIDKYFEFDDFYSLDVRSVYKLEGDKSSGFVFNVAHTFLRNSVPVGVELIINGIGSNAEPAAAAGEGSSSPDLINIYGYIAAVQDLTPEGDMTSPRNPGMILFHRPPDDPQSVSVGSPIQLDRKYIIAPAAPRTLWICYYLLCNGKTFASEVIPFPFVIDDGFVFITDKNSSHTRQSPDDLISISLQFMNLLFPDPPTCVPDQNVSN